MTGFKPLESDLAGDPELGELIQEFVAGLPAQIAAMEAALARSDLEALRQGAHRLRGSAGGYGFGPISQLAAVVEAAIREAEAGAPLDPCRLGQQVEELAALCRRAIAPAL